MNKVVKFLRLTSYPASSDIAKLQALFYVIVILGVCSLIKVIVKLILN